MAGGLQRLSGVFAMLAFREDWRKHFDVSMDGLWASFSAALWGLPFFVLTVWAQNDLVRELASDSEAARTTGFLHAAILYFALWAYFPPIAHIFCRSFKIDASFAPWVVVHNWTVLMLVILQGLISLLLIGGILSAEAYISLRTSYLFLAIFAHCRAAVGALDAPWSLAIGGACVTIILWLMMQIGLAFLLQGSAIQA